MRKLMMGLAGIVVLVMASARAAQMKPMPPEGQAPGTTQAPSQQPHMP